MRFSNNSLPLLSYFRCSTFWLAESYLPLYVNLSQAQTRANVYLLRYLIGLFDAYFDWL